MTSMTLIGIPTSLQKCEYRQRLQKCEIVGHNRHHRPGSRAIKVRRSHFWSQSHFSFIYSFTKSEIEMKSDTVSLLWPQSQGCVLDHSA